MRPIEWMARVLERRGLQKPDGRPLYNYRINDSEFVELTGLLTLSGRLGIANIYSMLRWDAVFVMYAAEWWRRCYAGHWGWDGIFQSLGIDYTELSVGRRNDLVETGLLRWGRDVRVYDQTRKFLGTVATEGGLPLNQLTESGGWLKHLLKPVLRAHIGRGIDLETLVESYSAVIPTSYRSNEINQILFDIAQTVVMLRDEHQLAERERPIRWLDEHKPDWRDKFPLPVEDQVARSLLSDLIDTASKATRSAAAVEPFNVQRSLIRATTPDPELIAILDVPTYVPVADIGLQFKEERLPATVNLEVAEPNGASWPWCRAILTVFKNQSVLKLLSGRQLKLTGADATKELQLRIKAHGETIAEIPIAHGDPLDTHVPWLFKQVDEEWIFQGQASQAVRADRAMVYVPGGCAWEAMEIEPNQTEVLSAMFEGALLRFSGELHVNADDAAYKFSTGSQQTTVLYRLSGKRLPFLSAPAEIYVGCPAVVETNLITGNHSTKQCANLVAKSQGIPGDWHPLSAMGPGCYEVRLLDLQGHVLLRKRIGLLPKDFSVELRPSAADATAGELVLHAVQGCAIGVSSSTVEVNIDEKDNESILALTAYPTPPQTITTSLLCRGHQKPLVLNLPFPSKGALLFDPEGQLVHFSTPLNVKTLQGFRIKVYDEKFHPGKRTLMRWSLNDPKMTNTALKDIYIQRRVNLHSELTEFTVVDWLPHVETLLEVSASLAASVTITLSMAGTEVFSMQVNNYENVLLQNREEGTLLMDDRGRAMADPEFLADAQVATLHLHQPEEQHPNLEAITSEGVPLGAWDFRPDTRRVGPWMIFPSADSSFIFRPTVWEIGVTATDDDISQLSGTLQQAVAIPDTAQRATAISHVMRQMVFDPEHRSWRYLDILLQKTQHLPMTTFDVWRVAIRETGFLAVLLVIDAEGLIKKLEEDLPVVWELVSMSEWERALDIYRQKLVRNLEDEPELVTQLVKKKIQRIETLSPAMISTGQILRQRLLEETAPELNVIGLPLFLQGRLQEEFQNLLRRQAENDWPSLMSGYIEGALSKLPTSYSGLMNTFHVFQKPVTYLPWILAWRAILGDDDLWPENAAEIFKIRQLREFDEDWFNATYQFLTGWLSQQTDLGMYKR